MENSAYMESIVGDRAVLAYEHDEEGAPRRRAAHLRRDRPGRAARAGYFHLHQREFRRVPRVAEDATKQVEYNLAVTRSGKLFVWSHTFLDKENLS